MKKTRTARRIRDGVRPRLMGRDDWYRHTTWTENDQAEFFERLRRSRGTFHKAQYMRIQALYLPQSGLHAEALTLLNMQLRDYPEEDTQVTGALLQKAECLWSIGDHHGAFETYTNALAAQRRSPGRVHHVAISFAERFWDYEKARIKKC